jgi:hypothetical protein
MVYRHEISDLSRQYAHRLAAWRNFGAANDTIGNKK